LDSHYFKYNLLLRLKIIFGFVAFCLLLLLIRLFYLQIIQYDLYHGLSNKNSIKIVPLPPNRGIIFDRNQEILAQNYLSYTLELNKHTKINIEETKNKLANIIEITNNDINNYKEQLRKYHFYDTAPIKFNLSLVQITKFISQQHQFPELSIKQGFVRHYPLGHSSAHIIGYINRINHQDIKKLKQRKVLGRYLGTNHIGKSGVELYYEDIIHGTPGYKKIEVDANQEIVRVLKIVPPISGKNISLTIDSKLQKIAEDAFKRRKGALVAINPNNGEILAYVSQPTFNPRLFTNGIKQTDWDNLNNKLNKPLLDRVLSGLYPPGSTLKPFVALAALENNIRTPPFSIQDHGSYTMPNGSKTFNDWKEGGHGTVDLIKAITVSCDTFFYGLGVELGIPKLNKTLRRFGFGKKTQIDIHNERSGLLANEYWKKKRFNQPWYQGETAITAIGQGFTLVTPIQLALATAKLAKPDITFKPHVLLSIENTIDTNQNKYGKGIANTVENSKYLDWVKEGMQNVTRDGGTAAFIGKNANYKMAAKTGTAQVFGLKKNQSYDEQSLPDHLKDHALFIAYAPIENPKLAIAVIVENGGHGGSIAGPIAKKVFDAYLEKVN